MAKGKHMPANSSADGKCRAAVIGLGMGKFHAQEYQKHARSELVALCDANAERLGQRAKELGVPAERCFTDHRKLLGAAKGLGLSGVSVALPNALHAPVTIDALRAGLHVLCEKPMAMNAGEARRMIAAAAKARRRLMVCFSYRFRPDSIALKRTVDSGAIGELYFGRTTWLRRRGLPGFGGWFGQKALSGGGPIIDLGVHRLDLAMWLMGSPRPVTVSASVFDPIARRLAKEKKVRFDVEDLGCALVRFDNGATLVLEASWAGFQQKREEMTTRLLGTRGGIVQQNVGEGYDFEAHVYTERDGSLWECRLQQTLLPVPSPMSEFADAVLDGRETSAPGEHGLAVQLVLDAIYKSAAVGREVAIRRAP